MIRSPRLAPELFPESSITRRILESAYHNDEDFSAGPEHGELWLVSYADLMTLLFGFFVMLYADSGRLQEVKATFLTETSPQEQSGIENEVLKERILNLESKLKLAEEELNKKNTSLGPTILKQDPHEEARLLFRMPCRFCANFSNTIDSSIAGHLQAGISSVVITHVTRGGPADLAGIRAGDLIETIAGRNPAERGLFESFPVGQEVDVSLKRFGKSMMLKVRLDSISSESLAALQSAPAEESRTVGGIRVSRIGPKERIMHYIPSEIEGALVTRGCDRCRYSRNQVEAGDVIVSVNGIWIQSPEQLDEVWGDQAVLEVWKKGSRAYELVLLEPGMMSDG